jgi:hypothetical protein
MFFFLPRELLCRGDGNGLYFKLVLMFFALFKKYRLLLFGRRKSTTYRHYTDKRMHKNANAYH